MRITLTLLGRTLLELAIDHDGTPGDGLPHGFGFGGSTLIAERAEEPAPVDDHTR